MGDSNLKKYFITKLPTNLPEDFFKMEVQLRNNGDNNEKGDVIESKIQTILEKDGKSTNTIKKLNWGFNVFKKWLAKNDLQFLATEEFLNKTLPRFIILIRKENEENYASKTLLELVIAIQEEINRISHTSFKFLSDSKFKRIKLTLDERMKEISSETPMIIKKANVIDIDKEATLWDKGYLGSLNPKQLIDSVIFVVGINLALRGRSEHRALTWGNFTFESEKINYRESVSKSNNGGIKHRKIQPKTVTIFSNPNPDRCPVKLIKQYRNLCPSTITPDMPFYLTPMVNYSSYQWFSERPIGVNTISDATKRLMKNIDNKFYSNHSLRRTAITRLYQNGIEEQQISEISGHRSVAVRQYKETCEQQREECSKIIQGSSNQIINTSADSCSRTLNFNGVFENCHFIFNK